MKARLLLAFVFTLSQAFVLTGGVNAQDSEASMATPPGGPINPRATAVNSANEPGAAGTVTLGQPELSYRYVQTFGITDLAYRTDVLAIQPAGHTNRQPVGARLTINNELASRGAKHARLPGGQPDGLAPTMELPFGPVPFTATVSDLVYGVRLTILNLNSGTNADTSTDFYDPSNAVIGTSINVIGAGGSLTLTVVSPIVPHAYVGYAIVSSDQPVTATIAAPTALLVTNNNDSGPGSLRQAISDAVPGTTITFAPQISGTITLASGQLVIDKSLTISGPGAATLAVSGNSASRVITTSAGISVTISGLALQDGNTGFGGVGGGIYNAGNISLMSCQLTNNSAFNAGAAIYNAGALTISNCTVASNNGVYSGIVYNSGALTVESSSLVNNNTGGGSNLTASIVNDGVLTMNNSTVSGNTVQGGPGTNLGGVYNSGIATINNSTITDNASFNVGGGIAQAGGVISLTNTILAGNLGPVASPNCTGTLSSDGYNLIDDTTGCVVTGTTIGNVTGLSANLGPLQDNGGPTFTQALLPGSPAIDAGNPATPGSGGTACALTDQRGITRPQGVRCDIGAYEVSTLSPVAPTGVLLGGPSSGLINSLYTFSATISPITTTTPITFAWQAAGQTLMTHTAGLSDTITYNWSVPGPQIITVTANNGIGLPVTASRTMTLALGAEVTVTPSITATLTFTDASQTPTTVLIPPGAVTQTTTLRYTALMTPTVMPTGFAFAGHAFTLEAYPGGLLASGFVFAKPVTVTVTYTDSDVAGVDRQGLILDYWNGSSWADAAKSCNPASTYNRNLPGHQFAVAICHLSQFAVFGPTQHLLFLPLVTRGQ